jgi:hypothetical protein
MRFSQLGLRALDVHQLTRLALSSVARSSLARRLLGGDERDMGVATEYCDCLAPPRVPHKILEQPLILSTINRLTGERWLLGGARRIITLCDLSFTRLVVPGQTP